MRVGIVRGSKGKLPPQHLLATEQAALRTNRDLLIGV
jgi:hypothetical protein